MRIFKTLAVVAGIYISGLILEVGMALSSANYEGGVTALVVLGFLAFLAPKVGYRWFDCFFAAIPIYGLFFIFRIAFRVAYLPNRDWSERIS
jgi:hypothetical protein